MDDEFPANFVRAAELLTETMELGAISPDVLAAVGALANDPTDQLAKEYLDEILAPKRCLAKLFPDPFSPNPLPGEVDGPFRFGTNGGANVGLRPEHVERGVVVIGRTGSGKSELIYSLIESLLNDPEFRVNYFTKKSEDCRLMTMFPGKFNWLPFGFPLNYIAPNGLKASRAASHFSTLFGHACNFWFGGQALLTGAAESQIRSRQAAGEPYPTIKELLAYLHGLKVRERRLVEQLASVREKLGELVRAMDEGAKYSQGLRLEGIADKNNIFFVPTDISPAIARFHVLYLHSWQFEHRRLLPSEELARSPIVVNVFDDATSFFHIDLESQGQREGNLPPLFDLMTMQRAYRMGSVVATHAPQMLARCVFDSRAATICLSLPGGGALDAVTRSLLGRRLTSEQCSYITTMSPGEGIVALPNRDAALRFTAVRTTNASCSVAEADALMDSFWERQGLVREEAQAEKETSVSDAARRFLMQVANHPDFMSSEHYRALSLSLAAGTRIRQKLVDSGFILVHRVATGRRGGQPEVIELTTKGYEVLGLYEPKKEIKGGVQHRFWCMRIKRWLEVNPNA